MAKEKKKELTSLQGGGKVHCGERRVRLLTGPEGEAWTIRNEEKPTYKIRGKKNSDSNALGGEKGEERFHRGGLC